jgi:hypothetical protein
MVAIVSDWQGESAAKDGPLKLSLRLRVQIRADCSQTWPYLPRQNPNLENLEYRNDIHLTRLCTILVREHYQWLPASVQHKYTDQSRKGNRQVR